MTVTDAQFLRNLADALPELNPLYEHEARDVRAAAARMEALEGIVRQVANPRNPASGPLDCAWCGAIASPHASWCPISQARALLPDA